MSFQNMYDMILWLTEFSFYLSECHAPPLDPLSILKVISISEFSSLVDVASGFLPKKVAILALGLFRLSCKYFNVAPLLELKVGPRRHLIPKVLLSAV